MIPPINGPNSILKPARLLAPAARNGEAAVINRVDILLLGRKLASLDPVSQLPGQLGVNKVSDARQRRCRCRCSRGPCDKSPRSRCSSRPKPGDKPPAQNSCLRNFIFRCERKGALAWPGAGSGAGWLVARPDPWLSCPPLECPGARQKPSAQGCAADGSFGSQGSENGTNYSLLLEDVQILTRTPLEASEIVSFV